MMTDSDAPEPPDLDRYRAIEYRSETGLVTIIQDTENEEAWVQSDVREPVRQ